jgi:hypothetical protein
MGSGVSVSEADAHACKGDVVVDPAVKEVEGFGECVSKYYSNGTNPTLSEDESPRDYKQAAPTKYIAASHGDEYKFLAKTESFMKQSLSTGMDIESIKGFLSNPTSMQLYKMFLKKKMGTPDALSVLTVGDYLKPYFGHLIFYL